MGLRQALRLNTAMAAASPISTPNITSALGSFTFPAGPATFSAVSATLTYVSRAEAMTVPAVARARNLICQTIGTLPRQLIANRDGTILGTPLLLKQPDPSVPASYTYAWTVDDLLFYGVAYWLVLTTYKENGRPATARRIDPQRISYSLDASGYNIIGYQLDGNDLPQGALIAYYGTEEGILARAGRTIRAAIELEKAAQRYAEEALPSVVIRNTGPDMPADEVQSLLDTWKSGRASRATAYLSGSLTAETLGMDPASLQLTDARAYLATEIGRLAGIPAWYLNASNNGMVYSNVTQERRDLIDFSLRPYLSIIEDRLSMSDITAGGTTVRHDYDDFLRGNPTERTDIATKLLAAGIISTDEARNMVDLIPKVGN